MLLHDSMLVYSSVRSLRIAGRGMESGGAHSILLMQTAIGLPLSQHLCALPPFLVRAEPLIAERKSLKALPIPTVPICVYLLTKNTQKYALIDGSIVSQRCSMHIEMEAR
ncbi:hypothetical protein LP420_40000 [Massilia sp. B-10]|nr:hypothetical protein LP420_40000 [Massilia sp. B-10]UUZ54367.1 hypothetical protein LP419_39395 [Massilia sp. H-1]